MEISIEWGWNTGGVGGERGIINQEGLNMVEDRRQSPGRSIRRGN